MSSSSPSSVVPLMGADYNDNSSIQLSAVKFSADYIRQAIDVLDIEMPPLVIIADYGASHGSNSMYAMQFIIQTLKGAKKFNEDQQQILVVHNDLSNNNWTSLFEGLKQNNPYCALASGRSFYEQCLPSESLAIGYTSTSLHWLSKKPCNLSDQCLVHTSTMGNEIHAFKQQAALDYAHFLENRSRELLPGGVLILVILGDAGKDSRDHGALLYKCAEKLLSPAELLEYTMPIYCRSYSECVDNELFAKYNLELIKAETVSIPSTFGEQLRSGAITIDYLARVQTMAVRVACEQPLKQALMSNRKRSSTEIERMLEEYWNLHEREIKESFTNFDSDMVMINIILKKIKK